jgi:hypothetical protein
MGARLTQVFPAKDENPGYAGALDLTVGQEAAITDGAPLGWVFKLDGVYPISYTGSLLWHRAPEHRRPPHVRS